MYRHRISLAQGFARLYCLRYPHSTDRYGKMYDPECPWQLVEHRFQPELSPRLLDQHRHYQFLMLLHGARRVNKD